MFIKRSSIRRKISLALAVTLLAGNVQPFTLFARAETRVVPMEGTALFDVGQEVNAAMKRAAGNSEAVAGTPDNIIETIAWSESGPEEGTASFVVSSPDSKQKIVAWYESAESQYQAACSERQIYADRYGDEITLPDIYPSDFRNTVFLYTEAKTIVLNSDSSEMFSGFSSLDDIRALYRVDFSQVESLSGFFAEDYALMNLSPIENADVSQVTVFDEMFWGNTALTDVLWLMPHEVTKGDRAYDLECSFADDPMEQARRQVLALNEDNAEIDELIAVQGEVDAESLEASTGDSEPETTPVPVESELTEGELPEEIVENDLDPQEDEMENDPVLETPVAEPLEDPVIYEFAIPDEEKNSDEVLYTAWTVREDAVMQGIFTESGIQVLPPWYAEPVTDASEMVSEEAEIRTELYASNAEQAEEGSLYSVTLTAEDGFPEDATAWLEVLEGSELEAVTADLQSCLPEKQVNVNLPLWIGILDQEGFEYEPERTAHVKICLESAEILEQTALFHQSHDGSWEELEYALTTDDESWFAEFDTVHFSPFLFVVLSEPEVTTEAESTEEEPVLSELVPETEESFSEDETEPVTEEGSEETESEALEEISEIPAEETSPEIEEESSEDLEETEDFLPEETEEMEETMISETEWQEETSEETLEEIPEEEIEEETEEETETIPEEELETFEETEEETVEEWVEDPDVSSDEGNEESGGDMVYASAGLDPGKVELWREELKREEYSEDEVADMVASLLASPGTLQYAITAGLRQTLSEDAEPTSPMEELPDAEQEEELDLSDISLQAAALPVADAGGVITLDQDYTETLVIPAGETVTIDLNGYSLRTPAGTGSELITVYGNLTVRDSAGGGAISGTGTTNTRAVRATSRSSFTLQSGAISGFTSTGNGGGLYVESSGYFRMEGGEVSGNTSDNNGGGIFVYDVIDADFAGGVISGNTAMNGGGLALYSSSDGIAIEHVYSGTEISGNTATNYGGGVYVDQTANLCFQDCSIEENSAKYGGGIFFLSTSACTVDTGSGVVRNQSYNAGGGVRLNGSALGNSLTIRGAVDENESTHNSGGGVYIAGDALNKNSNVRTTVLIDGGTVDRNRALNSGAGMSIANGSNDNRERISVTISGDGSVSDNVSTGTSVSRYGAGIYITRNATVVLDTGELSRNKDVCSGGGLYCGNYGNITINEGFSVAENEIHCPETGYGGGIYMGNNARMSMTGGEIRDNLAEGATMHGGGVYHSGTAGGTSILYSGGVVTGNIATGNESRGGGLAGGAIYIQGTAKVTDNQSVTYGGGVSAGSCYVSGEAEISNNKSANGGGIWTYNGVIQLGGDSKVINNTATNSGGGAWGSVTVKENALISGNSASKGGGINVEYNTTGVYFRMTGGTITGNKAGTGAGVAIQCFNTNNYMSGGEISNNISTGNGGGIYILPSAYTFNDICKFTVSGTALIAGNHAETSGGGIFRSNNGVVIMTGGTIRDNTAGNYGGGIYSSNNAVQDDECNGQASLQVTGGSILDNRADNRGNDIYSAMDIVRTAIYLNSKWSYRWNWSRHQIAAAGNLYNMSPENRWYNETLDEYTDQAVNNTAEVTALYATTTLADRSKESLSGVAPKSYGGLTFVYDFSPVARIGEVMYSSVQEAADAIEDGTATGTDIVMLRDHRENVVFAPDLGSVSLDLAGFALKGMNSSVISVKSGTSLSILDSSATNSDGTDGTGKITEGYGRSVGSVVGCGGGLYLESGSSATLISGSIVNNTLAAANNGSQSTVYMEASTSFTMDGGVIGDGSKSFMGVRLGGNHTTFIMNGGEIRECSHKSYGAVGNTTNVGQDSHVIINGGSIHDNAGNGVYMISGSTVLTGGSIYNNIRGIYLSATSAPQTFTMTGGEIYGNSTPTGNYGGGIAIWCQCDTVISGGYIHDNRAVLGGGGIAMRTSTLRHSVTFTDDDGGVVITGNTAEGAGGGIYLYDDQRSTAMTYNFNGMKVYENTSLSSEANDIYLPANRLPTGVNLLAAEDMGLAYDSWLDGEDGTYITEALSGDKDQHWLTAAIEPEDSGVYVARINRPDDSDADADGNLYFKSIQKAVNSALEGETIHLLTDTTESFVVNQTRVGITLNLNGYTVIPDRSQIINQTGGSFVVTDDPSQADYNPAEGAVGTLYAGDTVETRAVQVIGGSFEFAAGEIHGFSGVDKGAALYGRYLTGSPRATITVSGGKIYDCEAEFGGAIAGESCGVTITDGEIYDCTSTVHGGAVFMAPVIAHSTSPVTFRMDGGTIHDCAGNAGGAIFFLETQYNDSTYKTYAGTSHSFVITGGEIYNCEARTSAGGAVYLRGPDNTSRGTVSISNLSVHDCTSYSTGGGLWIQRVGPVIENLTIENCQSRNASAGGMYIYESYNAYGYTLRNVSVTGCEANTNGGGLYLYHSASGSSEARCIVENLEATGNTTGREGGGIYLYGACTMRGMTLNDNSAGFKGGALRLNGYSPVYVYDSVMERNFGGGYGGAVYFYFAAPKSMILMDHVDFRENEAALGGAVYYQHNGYTGAKNFVGCTFENNHASDNGGALYDSYNSSGITMDGCTLKNNSAVNNGGAIYLTCGRGGLHPLNLTGGTLIESNTAVIGGGICNNYWHVKVTDAVLRNNTATSTSSGGGGIYTYVGSVTMEAPSIIEGNNALYGGGMYTLGATNNSNSDSQNETDYYRYTVVALNGGTITGNTATYGGGVANGNYSRHFTMNGVTITGNTAAKQGGGVWSNAVKTTCTLTDGAIYDNKAGLGQDVYVIYSSSAQNSYIDLIKAEDMFGPEDGKTGICWFDETSEETIETKVQGRLQIRTYPLTLRYREEDKVVAVIGEEEFPSVQAALSYIADGNYTGTDIPQIMMVDDSVESAVVPGGISCILNLNGHTLTGSGTSALTCSGGEIAIIDDTSAHDREGEGPGTITGSAAVSGGGIRVINGGSVRMSSGQVSGCIAGNYTNSPTYGGAAVSVEEGSFELAGTASLNNNQAYHGAAVSVTNAAGTFKMTGGKIENNTSSASSIVHVYYGKAIITGGEISNNVVQTGNANSGTILVNGGSLNVAGDAQNPVEIYGNQSANKGGGLTVLSGSATLGNVNIHDNRVTNARSTSDATVSAGGGVYVEAGSVTISSGCDIYNNYAPRGGGVFIKQGSVKMIGGKVRENQAQIGGGVAQYYAKASEFILSGGVLAGNVSLTTATGNDLYSAYEGTAAGLARYLAENDANHPKATLIQAQQMGDPRYNVWQDDTYSGTETGGEIEYILVREDGEGNPLPTYLGQGRFITAYVLSSQNLQLTAAYYPIEAETAFDTDMHVAGIQAHVENDGTKNFDSSASSEVTAMEKLESGEAVYSTETYQYASDADSIWIYGGIGPDDEPDNGNHKYNYIEYNGELYEAGQVVSWAPGDDSAGKNQIVRSFDTVNYVVSLAVEPNEQTEAHSRKVRYWIEAELPYPSELVEFDTALSGVGGYAILSRLDDYGNQIQVLRAYWDYELTAEAGADGGEQVVDSFSVSKKIPVKVWGMKNGETIKPTFRAWVDGNSENEESPATAQPEILTVSAIPKYNVSIESNKELAYTSYFDLVTGEELSAEDAANSPNAVYGTMLGYGITVSLYNEVGKKLKGIELPDSPLEFNLRLNGSLFQDGDPLPGHESGAYFWAYKENAKTDIGRSLGSAIDDRNMNWNDDDDVEHSTSYAYNAAPFNSGGGTYGCYSGGTWMMSGPQYDPDTDGDESQIHFTVYGFGFNNTYLPNGTSNGAISSAFNADNVKPFTAGYVQVLFPFDKNAVDASSETYLSIDMHAAVVDFVADSISGQPSVNNLADLSGRNSLNEYFRLVEDEMDGHDTGEMKYSDNYCPSAVGAYLEPGGEGVGDKIYKYNDFLSQSQGSISGDGGQGSTPISSRVFIRGWAQWYSAAYRTDDTADPLHYIEPEVYNTQTDNLVEYNYMTSMNLLQKFDADAFTPVCTGTVIDASFSSGSMTLGGGCYVVTTSESPTSWSNTKTTSGKLSVLYAAKPDGTNWTKGESRVTGYEPGGQAGQDVWDLSSDNTIDNDGGTREMDRYREENLLYFTSMADLKAYFQDKYGTDGKCVGLLYEFRDICIRDDRTLGVNALMDVTNDFARVGHTYATTNDVRAWSTYRHTYKLLYRNSSAYSGRERILYNYTYLDHEADEAGGVTAYGTALPTGTVFCATGNSGETVIHDEDYHTLPTPDPGYEGLWTGFSAHRYNNGYKKTEYVYGNKLAGTHNGWRSGNNVVLYTLDSSITIRLTDKEMGSNATKINYNVSNGERTVHYNVTPTLDISSAVQYHNLVTNGTQETAVEISLTLDKGLHYDEGTLLFDYSLSGYEEGELEWTVNTVENPDGTTTVFLSTSVYDISKDLPTFSYSASIGDLESGLADVYSGQVLNTVARIRAKYTSVNAIAANARTDQVSIKVAKSEQSIIAKTVGERLVEVGEDLVYYLRLNNLSLNMTNFHFGDVLPYNGDGRNTEFTGGYRVKEIRLEFTEAADYSSFRQDGWFRTAPNQVVPQNSDDMNTLFTSVTQDLSAIASFVDEDPVDLAIVYTFNANTLVQRANASRGILLAGYFPTVQGKAGNATVAPGMKLRLTLTPLDADPSLSGDVQLITDSNSETQTGGDVYGNAFFYRDNNDTPVHSSRVDISTIDRVISGRVWLDQNRDGLYTPMMASANDHPLENVTATLYQAQRDEFGEYVLDGSGGYVWEPAINIIGNDVAPVLTDGSGFYKFSNLAEGEYMVVFTEASGTQYRLGDTHAHPIAFNRLTVSQMQTDATNGNKSYEVFDGEDAEMAPAALDHALLYTAVAMPDKAYVQSLGSHYTSPNWNAALHYTEAKIVKKWVNIPQRVEAGASVTLTLTGTTPEDTPVYERTWTLTQGTSESSVTVSPALNTPIESLGVVKVQDSRTAPYTVTWTVHGVALQTSGTEGEIAYEFTEDMFNGVNYETEASAFEYDENTGCYIARVSNTRKYAPLILSKTVIGTDSARTSKTFTFTVTAAEMAGRAVAVTIESAGVDPVLSSQTFNSSGKITISLKHGQVARIDGLPVGTSWTVAETVPSGYQSSVAYRTGAVDGTGELTAYTPTGVMPDAAVYADFTNTEVEEVNFNKAWSSMTQDYISWPAGQGALTFVVTRTATGEHSEHQADQSMTLSVTGSAATITGTTIPDNVTLTREAVTAGGGTVYRYRIRGLHKIWQAEVEDVVYEGGWAYTIAEIKPDGYTATYYASASDVEPSENAFTGNGGLVKNRPCGDLRISKQVTGTYANQQEDFTFTVTFTDPDHLLPAEIAYTKGEETGTCAVTDGVCTFTLKHGEEIVLQDIPYGVSYVIAETDGEAKGYVMSVEGDLSGTVQARSTSVAVTNDLPEGDLIIKKIVDSVSVDDDPDTLVFNFIVTLTSSSDLMPEQVEYVKGEETGTLPVTEGKISFTLRDTESIRLCNLPYGLGYTIMEPDAAENSYAVTFDESDTGTIMAEETEVTVTNTYVAYIYMPHVNLFTGGGGKSWLFTIVLAWTLGLCAAFIWNRRRKDA